MRDEYKKLLLNELENLIHNWDRPNINKKISALDALFLFRILLKRNPKIPNEIDNLIWKSSNSTFKQLEESILNSEEFKSNLNFIPGNSEFMSDINTFRFWFNTTDREMGIRMGMGLYESDVMNFLKSIIDKGMVCYDIGAQTGYVTCFLGDLVGGNGKVYAFEPNPASFKLLEKNVKENKFNEFVICQNKACSDVNDKIPMSVEGGMFVVSPEHTASTKLIDCVRLDDIVDTMNGPNFIKLDVEGHELSVLKGMKNILSKYKPLIILELNQYWLEKKSKISASTVLHYLNNMGYKVFALDNMYDELKADQFVQKELDSCEVFARYAGT